MKNRISFAIFLLLMSLYSWAHIAGNYNSAVLSDTGNSTKEYTLSLKATPSDGGSFNTIYLANGYFFASSLGLIVYIAYQTDKDNEKDES